MKYNVSKLKFSFVLLGLIVSLLYAKPDKSVLRFGLLIGANRGHTERKILNYAVSDARRLQSTLEDVGWFQKSYCPVVIQPNIRELDQKLSHLSLQIQQAKQNHKRVECLFYYSGHSDRYGLQLGNEKYN